jgi:nitrite reductase (NADH) small subunit/3-phenylpropionate/trans-cinnamate dioxygenase ferredoxin subunit
MPFVEVAKEGELKPGSGKTVNANGIPVALFNVDGKFYAISNTCLHRGGPLGEGELDGKVVTCPWHGWQYDVTTGKNVIFPAAVKKFNTKVENGRIFVEV